MSKIKLAKRVEFIVSINYNIENSLIKQEYKFWTNNKKNLRYAYDKRYLLKPKLEKLISDNLLDNFKNREENEDCIIMYYENDDKKLPNNKTVNLEFYLPPYNGCKYCTKAKEEGNFVYCEEKKKHYVNGGIKNCKVFSSIEEVLT